MAFFPSNAILLNNKADVVDDVLLGDGSGQHIVIMGKKEPHLLGVIADCTPGILLCQQGVMKLLQALLR